MAKTSVDKHIYGRGNELLVFRVRVSLVFEREYNQENLP